MPTLVLLAAGLGSRFGGPKQLEPLGPSGETLVDYALFDGARAGFDHAVLIVRAELRAAFAESIVPAWRDRMNVELVEQRLDDLPAGFTVPAERTKPWGTGQAVLATRGVVNEPFAVANADDFYGRTAYARLGAFLRTTPPNDALPTYAVVGFPLGVTLSPSGGVNRAVLRTSAEGWLAGIEEVMSIEPSVQGGGRYRTAESGLVELAIDAPVSMNLWGFTPAVFEQFDAGFREFLGHHRSDTRAEFLLPTYVSTLLARDAARVAVLRSDGPWCGLTHTGDRERARALLRELVDRGEYPADLRR